MMLVGGTMLVLLVGGTMLVALLVATGLTLFPTCCIVIAIVIRLEVDERRSQARTIWTLV